MLSFRAHCVVFLGDLVSDALFDTCKEVFLSFTDIIFIDFGRNIIGCVGG